MTPGRLCARLDKVPRSDTREARGEAHQAALAGLEGRLRTLVVLVVEAGGVPLAPLLRDLPTQQAVPGRAVRRLQLVPLAII